jgi:rhamnosyltransferase
VEPLTEIQGAREAGDDEGGQINSTQSKRDVLVCAVVVSFHPDLEALKQLLTTLTSQLENIVLVDNGSSIDVAAWVSRKPFGKKITVLPLGENRGIAVAQNIGITHARQTGADYVALFDQDSIPAPDMIEQLVSVAEAQAAKGVRIAAVGPRYLDPRQDNPPPFIRFKELKLERQVCIEENSVVEVDYLIASGCLISLPALGAVGGMREELFIDYVDIEWGLRAKQAGYKSFGSCAALMSHALGDMPIGFLGKKFPARSPLRHYYMFRNAVLLYKEPWVPLNWKLVDGWRLCLKYVFYSLFAKPRMAHWRMMTLGVWHGLMGKAGKKLGS